MNGFFIVIAVVVLVVLAAVALLGAARRRDTDSATGSLSRESIKRDRAARKEAAEMVPTGPSGQEVERSVALERRGGGDLEPVAAATPAVFVPPDPEAYDVSRRQFLNRGVIAMMGLSIAAFGTAIVGFLWPSGSSGFGSKINMGKVADLGSRPLDDGAVGLDQGVEFLAKDGDLARQLAFEEAAGYRDRIRELRMMELAVG